ncbi:NAD(P)/FAD-dependent oxidoreductase [Alteraurantiacibacter aestuarii]|uniref:NAD(P)-binding protein n=1 Tax=Alteraurantiacibacter aestuarii TaxID=650004 RepID=A0A844ZNX2_9SPHN|nr:NAD(P)/FAD-dependent oxidoreductase [Alteraurantiacibacter aestuarii]MXO87349.1 NAD(P)-binding protein [Alteraurantiacibacter aestuarii]
MRSNASDCDVLIVGAGIAGISMAAHLQDKCANLSFMMVERRAQPGGTWDLFRYPGVRSDSDMQTLGFAFEPWDDDQSIAPGGSILEYLRGVIHKRGIADHIRTSTTVISADWQGDQACWLVSVEGPDGPEKVRARWLYMSTGYYDYDHPYDAQITGLESFAGTLVHPQFWPENLDYADKRVVVIGSGATAVTLVPAMAEQAGHVTMLQRTPTWMSVGPSRDRLARVLRRILPRKLAYWLVRQRNIRLFDFLYHAARRNPHMAAEKLSEGVRKELGDLYSPEDFTPPYNPWEQRLCLVPDSDLFKSIRQGKASIVTAKIDTVQTDGIALEGGEVLPADIIVTATGLKLSLGGHIKVSIEGRPVNWGEEFFYRGCMISNVPNLTFVFGYLNASFTLRADNTAAYSCRVLNHLRTSGTQIAIARPPADGLVEGEPFPFSSGYLMRDLAQVPKSTDALPWRLNHDYLADCRDFRRNGVDDGHLQFELAPRVTDQSPVADQPEMA